MKTTRTPSRPITIARLHCLLNAQLSLILTSLLLSCCVAPADEPEDVYLRIYGVIQQGDELNTKGKSNAALAKYRQAQIELQDFHLQHPEWNAKVVSFRLNDLAAKVKKLSNGNAATAEGAIDQADGKSGSSTTQVKLLDPGAEPRKALRLHPQPGAKQSIQMTMKMSMTMKVGEIEPPAMKIPQMNMAMDFTVKDVTADGDINYELTVSDAAVADDTDVLPQISDAIKSAFGNFKGVSGSGTITSRGVNKKSELNMGSESNPQLRQVIDQLRDSWSNLSAPFPQEPVGPGAKWEVRMPIKSQGLTMTQTATYQVTSLEGDRLQASTTVIQNAPKQNIENPAMPGMKIELTKMTGSGKGEVTFDLGKVLPPAGHTDLRSEFSMAMDAGGQKQPMDMKMDLNLRFESK